MSAPARLPSAQRSPIFGAAVRLVLVGVAATLSWPGRAQASEYHYQSFMLGERAMGMGGAYTALGASPISTWYNPAGLAFSTGTRLSVQTGVYGLASERVTGSPDLLTSDSSQFLTFPSTGALSRRFGDKHFFGFAVVTPDVDHRSAHLVARNIPFTAANGAAATLDSFSLLQDDRDTTLWTGVSYAMRVHRRFSFGVSLFFPLRDRSLLSKTQATFNDQVAASTQVDLSSLHVSLLGMVGVRWEPIDGLFFGATFRTPNARILSTAKGSVSTFDADMSGRADVNLSGVQYKLPWRASFGVAYAQARRFSVAADISVHGAVDPYTFLEGTDNVGMPIEPELSLVQKDSVVNTNIGAEYWLGGIVPVRAGFFTNFSARGTPSARARELSLFGLSGVIGGQGDVPNRYGVTFGTGFDTGRTTLGLNFNYVFGESQAELVTRTAPRPVSLLLIGVSGSYAF